MTNSGQGQAAPGWYPTAPGSTQVRWWDGTQWTEHYQSLGVLPGAPDKAPAGTNPNTVWIWLLVFAPLLQFAELPLFASSFAAIPAPGQTTTTDIATSSISASLLLDGISLALAAVFIVLAALDFRALKARGVPAPFHWAWAFLGSLVYVIGRAVVVRRRTGTGLVPLWVYLIVTVAYIITTLAIIIPTLSAAVNSAVLTAG